MPAKLTWLLQPLDTHAFGTYKLAVQERYRRFLMKSASDVVSNLDCLRIIGQTIAEHLQKKSWVKSFEGNNYGGGEVDSLAKVRPRIWECLEDDGSMEVPDSTPTLSQFTCIFPKGRDPPLEGLMKFAKLY